MTMLRIGLLSDTHHFLDENIFKHFASCDEIWHAGAVPITLAKQAEVRTVAQE